MIWHLVYWWWSCHHLVIYQYRVDITFKQEIKANLGHDNSSQLSSKQSLFHLTIKETSSRCLLFLCRAQPCMLHASLQLWCAAHDFPGAGPDTDWVSRAQAGSRSSPGPGATQPQPGDSPECGGNLQSRWDIGHELSLDPIKCVNFIIRQRLAVCTSG